MPRPENTASRVTALRDIVIRASFLGHIMDHVVEIAGAALRVENPNHIDLKRDLVFREGDACAISFGVALARFLAINPDVILLEEPLSSLDPHLREEMRFEIKDLQRKYGFSIIYVTHDQFEAMSLSDRILVMKHGVVQQIDTLMNIYTKPANKFVFSFIGLSNFLETEGRGEQWQVKEAEQLQNGPLPPPEGRKRGRLSLASRPLEIDFAGDGHISGIVTRKVFLGDLVDLQVKTGKQYLRVQKGRREITPNVGDKCNLKFLLPFWYETLAED